MVVGESVMYAAARYCCLTGEPHPLVQLTKARADWTQPNRLGVSALLLLLRHTAAGSSPSLPPAACQLLENQWKMGWTRQVGAVPVMHTCAH